MMNAHPTRHNAPLLDVSPVLETGTPTPPSTHWIPLHELITCWTDVETLLVPAPIAAILTASGHALFALSQETRALRLYTLAWEKRQWHTPRAEATSFLQQALRLLQEAVHHWSRAAYSLDGLRPRDLDPAALARARQLSRIARTQQERLWALGDEILADPEVADLHGQHNIGGTQG